MENNENKKIGFRPLNANEVELRVQQIYSNGTAQFLIYKNARVDINLLNEVLGVGNWSRKHKLIGNELVCEVSIRTSHNDWVSYEDVGTAGNFEKEKSVYSDSFKRACVNLGIGIELYTAPTIYIKLFGDEFNLRSSNGKEQRILKSSVEFFVSKYEVVDNHIVGLEIKDNKGNLRFTYSENKKTANNDSSYNAQKDVYEHPIDYSVVPVKSKHAGKKWVELDLNTLTNALEYYKSKNIKEYIEAIQKAIDLKQQVKKSDIQLIDDSEQYKQPNVSATEDEDPFDVDDDGTFGDLMDKQANFGK